MSTFETNTESLVEEFQICYRIASGRLWLERVRQWDVHTTVFARLKHFHDSSNVATLSPPVVQTTAAPAFAATRIQFLFDHLNILDSKFGVLLNLNTLMLISVNIIVTLLLNTRLVPNVASSWWPVRIACAFVVLFGVIWFWATWLCVAGERRLVWGDLGLLSDGNRPTLDTFTKVGSLGAAEESHVQALIRAVIKRTSRFRVAIALVRVNVALMAGVCIVGLYMVWLAHPDFYVA